MNPYQRAVEEAFAIAGVAVNGGNTWDIQVNDERFFARVVSQGRMGLGESYMAGWWDCARTEEFCYRLLMARLEDRVRRPFGLKVQTLLARVCNLQSRRRAFAVAERHYNLGNDLFQAMLDRRLVYSCGYWKNAQNLDDAQEAKLELICRKLNLRPGLKVLDIGCGWGGFARYAAEKYEVAVTGVTISRDQVELGRELCRGWPVDLHLLDYRDIMGRFDRIAAIGVTEHIGYKNYRRFMEIANGSLVEGGVLLIHAICNTVSTYHMMDPWMAKYIFPNGMIPSLAQLAKAAEGFFVIEDCHNIGPDYFPTCLAWNTNFQRAWPNLQGRYSERFRRMWQYYLLSAAANFRAREGQVLQIVLTRPRTVQPACRLA